jgi:transposase
LRRKGMTLALLWEEYCAQVGDAHDPQHPVKPWRYSQFCENDRQFAKRLKRSMRQVHRAGEKLFESPRVPWRPVGLSQAATVVA